MDITLEKIDELNALIKVNLIEADYQDNIDKTIKDYTKNAVIKGFRPGKVPPALVKQRYGKEIKVEEVNKLVVKSLDNYIKENNIKIFASPLINREKAAETDWNAQNNFEFEFEIGLIPDFNTHISKDLTFDKYVIEFSESEFDDLIKKLRDNYPITTEAETVTEADFIKGTLKQIDGEFDQEQTLPLSQLKESFRAEFIGKKVGEVIEIEDLPSIFEKENAVKLWTSLPQEEVDKMTGKFTFTILFIQHKEAAELNEEFFTKITGKPGIETEEEFKKELKILVEQQREMSSANLLRRTIQIELIKKIDFALPDAFLKKFLVSNNENKSSEAEIAESYEKYKDSLKQGLIENKIGEELKIEVTNEDLLERTKELFRQQFSSYGNADFLTDDLLNTLANNYLNDKTKDNGRELYNQLYTEKLFDAVEKQVTIKDKKVSIEEFNKIAEEFDKSTTEN